MRTACTALDCQLNRCLPPAQNFPYISCSDAHAVHCDTLLIVFCCCSTKSCLILFVYMTQLAFSDVHNSIRLSAHHRVSHPFCARVASPRSRLTQAQCSVTVQSSQFITAARTDPGGQAKLLLSRRGALAAAAAALALPALTPRVAAADTGESTTKDQRKEMHAMLSSINTLQALQYDKVDVVHWSRRPAGVPQFTAGLQDRAASRLEPDK